MGDQPVNTDALTTDERCARRWLEMQRWPNGAKCPTCGAAGYTIAPAPAHGIREGLHQCRDRACAVQFTVTSDTAFGGTKMPPNAWLFAWLAFSQYPDLGAADLQRELGLGSYRTARFMKIRIGLIMREAIVEQSQWQRRKRTERNMGMLEDVFRAIFALDSRRARMIRSRASPGTSKQERMRAR